MIDTVMTTYPAMDPEVKVKWVEALRSGQFKQGEGYLKTRDGCNCCLGVLAEITGIQSKPSECEIDDGSTGWIPDDVMTFPRKVQLDLADMNDRGTTFVKIANYIEVNL